MHLKRQSTSIKWPIPRKGTAYVVRPLSNLRTGIPLLIVLRDMLKLAQDRREVKKILHQGYVMLNGKKAREERTAILLFDKIAILPLKKYYTLAISDKGKFAIQEVKEKDAEVKISKVVNKKILKGKRIQLNLIDGRNILSDEKCRVNDSVLINLKENKIEKILPLKEGARGIIFGGKHSGKVGVIESINPNDIIGVITENKEKINVLIKQLMVIE
ncbi:MAG: hypothetical protein KKA64_03070 [Nanoarchaeota archaeon]|nr:hypothetical protein [Nanoarchaeota archaeon]